MKIGISSWTYSWNIGVAGYPAPPAPMTAQDLVLRAAELGAQVVQIADNLPLHLLTDAELSSLRALADEKGVALEVGTRGVRMETLTAYLAIAGRLGSPILRTLLHDETGCPSLDVAEQAIRKALPALRKAAVTLAIENHDFFACADLRALIERIGDPHVRVCLDPVNNLAQGESAHDVFAALEPYTVNFHVKDFTVTRKPGGLGFDGLGCAAGDGLLNLPQCMRRFGCRQMSYVIELWTPDQGGIAATCALEERLARKSVAALAALQKSCQL